MNGDARHRPADRASARHPSSSRPAVRRPATSPPSVGGRVPRPLLVGLSVLTALAVVAIGDRLRPRSEPTSTVIVDQLAVQDRLFAARAAGPAGAEEPLGLLPDSGLGRVVVPERDARRLYPGYDRYTVWDRHTVFAHAPDVERAVRWPEHPDGGWRLATDALGMREDAPPAPGSPPLRVLVLGDSHTDGVCRNDESFANRLEALLAERLGVPDVEVLNGGKGGWCAYNYLGAVEKWRGLEPDLVLVALYGGNDLVEATLYRHYFERTERPPAQRALAVRVVDAAEAHPAAVSQVLAQTAYLTWTGELGPTVGTTARVLVELDRTCALLGSELLVVQLPAASSVEPERHRARIEPALATLGLAPDAVDVLARAREALAAALAAAGVETLDLTPALRAVASEARLYWERDLHLAPAGHAAVAAALADALLARPSVAALAR